MQNTLRIQKKRPAYRNGMQGANRKLCQVVVLEVPIFSKSLR